LIDLFIAENALAMELFGALTLFDREIVRRLSLFQTGQERAPVDSKNGFESRWKETAPRCPAAESTPSMAPPRPS